MNSRQNAEVTVALQLNQGVKKETGCILFLELSFVTFFLSGEGK